MMHATSVWGPKAARCLCLVVLATGCVEDPEVKPTRNPDTPATQPSPSGNARLTEQEACEALLEAITATEEDLNCAERDTPLTCPDMLRASSQPCAEYAKNTVDECVDQIQGYDSCDDFTNRRCIATALPGSGCEMPDSSVSPTDMPTDAGTVDGG